MMRKKFSTDNVENFFSIHKQNMGFLHISTEFSTDITGNCSFYTLQARSFPHMRYFFGQVILGRKKGKLYAFFHHQ